MLQDMRIDLAIVLAPTASHDPFFPRVARQIWCYTAGAVQGSRPAGEQSAKRSPDDGAAPPLMP
jgi:hypothetical protein